MRYSGKLGIVQQVEVAPGRFEDAVVEHDVMGTVEQRTETLQLTDTVHPTYRTTTSVSVFARENYPSDNSLIRYITYVGKRWRVESIVYQPPRMVIYIGEEYVDG